MALTPKQRRFVDEYLIDLNATTNSGGEGLARMAVAHWCGKPKPSERAMAEAGGVSRRRAVELWAQLMRVMIRGDAHAMATIEPAFISRGWS